MKSQTSDPKKLVDLNATRRGGTSLRLIGFGLISFTGLLAVIWGLNFSALDTTPRSLSAATKSNKDDQDQGQGRVKLNYFSASWPRVFQDLAESGNMEFISDKMPRGRFSRMDKTEYTRAEAIRIVNKEIEPQGLRLIEKGQFLILIDVATTRAQYPPAVLPKKSAQKPKPDEQEGEVTQTDHRTENTSKPRRGEITSADYQEEVTETPARRPSSRDLRTDASANAERTSPKAKRQSANRPVRQVSDEEQDDEAVDRRRPHPMGGSVPTQLENVGAPMPYVTYRAKHLNAVELSKRIYRAMKSEAELVDQGRNGLPAFRVVSGESRTRSKSQRNDHSTPIEFMISIDESRNELLIEGAEKATDSVLKLLRVVDRPEKDQTRTQIKPTTKYVCQIADQLPEEIDRLRNVNARQVARRPVDGKAPWVAEQAQRQVPEVHDTNGERQPNPRAKEPNADDAANEPIGATVGNFRGEVNIEVIDDLNVMIIRGNERDVEQIMEVIKRIEKLSEATAPEVHLIYLKNVDSESLAELMTSVYEKLIKFPGKATQPRESAAIIPISKPNALLIVAPGADAQSIIRLADELDKPVDPQTEFEVFALKSAVATDVEVLISEFYKERKALGAKVLVIADSRSNSVIVRARPRDLDEIKELIDRVDRDEVGAVNDMRIFVLKNAVANDVAATINNAIQSVLAPPRATSPQPGQIGGGGGGGGAQIDEQFKSTKSAVIQFLAKDKDSSRMVRSGILSDIRVTPDMHANAVIVTASEKSMELIEALINTLDRPTTTVSVIKVFPLENADASQMVIQLNSLFNNQQQQGGAPGQGGLRQALGIALANADDASSSLVPLKFSVDQRTNSIIAVGSADALRVVEAILFRLDESNLRARENKVIRLNNAPALQIAAAITQFFQQQRDLALNDPNLVSNVEQLEREVIVIPDTISNNLLVSSTPRYLPSIEQMIKKLDTVPKQVVIQAMIVEVQLNNTDEFGIELGLQSPVLFDRSLKQTPVVQTITQIVGGGSGVSTTTQNLLSQEGTPGFNFNNPGVPLGNNILAGAGTVGGQSLTNFSVGRTNSDLGYGGLVLSAGSNSVNALLRALSANRKIQILSRPQIRALDSQEARVFVGQTVPTVTNFIANQATGVLTPTLTQRETGIGMNVLPRINQDGNIVIALYAYRSQLSKETVSVTTDSRGQPIGQRITDLSNVQSTVLVPSNSTIVIGGMISSRDETSVRKAPLVGDLPVIGHLFRFDSRSAVRTELLIFLTPRIVDGPEEEECLKEVEMGRIHFIESEAEEMHGPLRALPAPDEVFMEGDPNWIGPDADSFHQDVIGAPTMQAVPSRTSPQVVPPAPTLAPTPATVSPQNSISPTLAPPSPTQELPPKPSAPNPDPNVTQIKALRTLATEADEKANYDKVTTANWTPPSAPKKSPPKPKKSSTTQKQTN